MEENKGLFTSGIDSFYHLIIGIFISFVPSLVFPICILYQIISPIGSTDLQEVLCGYILGTVIYGFAKVSFLIQSIL